MGILSKAQFTPAVEGNWNFKISLSDVSSSQNIEMGQKVDGTRIPYLTNGGGLGYTDSSMTSAYQIAGYNRVIDVDEIAALIVLTSYENEKVEIPISK